MVPSNFDISTIQSQAEALHLSLLGVLGVVAEDPVPTGIKSIALFGPLEPGFWDHFTQTPEFLDGAPDPLDRWSARNVGNLAAGLGGQALFPFDKPVLPFVGWALRTGLAYASPVAMLVHPQAGLFLSIRGAVAFTQPLDEVTQSAHPCQNCPAPCKTACPVNALSPEKYDVAACHRFLDMPAGQDCLENGCAARRACPVSKNSGRVATQSAFHMRHFHP